MKISMMQSIQSIHTKPKFEVKKHKSNKEKSIAQDVNRAICLKLVINGEKSIDILSKKLNVNRVTVIKYLNYLKDENLILFVCNKNEKTKIIGPVK